MKNLIKKKIRNSKGQSLIELMIAVAIIGMLAVIMIPNYRNHVTSGAVDADYANMYAIAEAVELFKKDNMRLPNNFNELELVISNKGPWMRNVPVKDYFGSSINGFGYGYRINADGTYTIWGCGPGKVNNNGSGTNLVITP